MVRTDEPPLLQFFNSFSSAMSAYRFRDEFKDFLRFVWRPRLSPRLPGQRLGKGWWVDWTAGLRLKRLLQWAGILWLLNAMLFGPLAAAAAGAGGAEHRLDMHHIPWLHALIWAPIVEELVFRYGLRRPAQLLWFLPVSTACLFLGPAWYSQLLLLGALVLWFYGPAAMQGAQFWPHRGAGGGRLRAWVYGYAWPWSWRKRYIRFFSWLFYASTLLFAGLHLYNFNLQQVPWMIWPLLVIPQCFTGLALGWLRVRHGIGASIALHALFNGGPLLLIFIVISLL